MGSILGGFSIMYSFYYQLSINFIDQNTVNKGFSEVAEIKEGRKVATLKCFD